MGSLWPQSYVIKKFSLKRYLFHHHRHSSEITKLFKTDLLVLLCNQHNKLIISESHFIINDDNDKWLSIFSIFLICGFNENFGRALENDGDYDYESAAPAVRNKLRGGGGGGQGTTYVLRPARYRTSSSSVTICSEDLVSVALPARYSCI